MALTFTSATTSTSNTGVSLGVSLSGKHRSRRIRRQRRNVVSFSSDHLDESSSSEEEEYDVEHSFATSVDVPNNEEMDLGKMEGELDSLVRYIRRGVEGHLLEEGGSMFEVLAFALEDWDL